MSGGAYKRFLEARAREEARPVCLPHPLVQLLYQPRTRRQFLTYAAALAAVAATPRVRGGTQVNPPAGYAPNTQPYPRTYLNMMDYNSGIYLSTTNTNAGVPLSTVVAQSNGITIAPFLAIEESDNLNETLDSLFSGWKSAANSNGVTLKCFNYISPNAPTFNSAGGNWYPWYNNALIFSSMFAYTSASGSGTTDLLPYNGAPDQSFLETCLTNAQTVSASYSQNGKTGVLAGASAWQLPAQYFVDVYYNGLATSKYGEASAPAKNSEIDGFFQDNSAPVAPGTDSGIAATWNGLGTTPVLLTPSTQEQYQKGLAALFQEFKSVQSMLVLSNGANGAVYFANGDISSLDPSLEGTVDLAFTEAAIGMSSSLETFHNTTPGEWMTPMIQGEAVLSSGGVIILHQVGPPGGVSQEATVTAGTAAVSCTNDLSAGQQIAFQGSLGSLTGFSLNTLYYVLATGKSGAQFEFSATNGGAAIIPGGSGSATLTINNLTGNQSAWGTTQWQAVRFGFAAAMQRNWWYALNCGAGAYNSVGLMDEQFQGGSFGWLSNGTQRLDPPQSAAWSNGVWRRRFPNGWVLWNPRGNGEQTVSVPTTIYRLKHRTDGPDGTGYGDPLVNNGQQITGGVATLGDADGLFLIGAG
jgi:hypothetical protein